MVTAVDASRADGIRDVTDERLLVELETALAEPRVDELRAIDAYTPRVRDASLSR